MAFLQPSAAVELLREMATTVADGGCVWAPDLLRAAALVQEEERAVAAEARDRVLTAALATHQLARLGAQGEGHVAYVVPADDLCRLAAMHASGMPTATTTRRTP